MARDEPDKATEIIDLTDRLPEAYARTLAQVQAGASDRAIAEAIGVDVAAVPALVRVAAAKLLDVLATGAITLPDADPAPAPTDR